MPGTASYTHLLPKPSRQPCRWDPCWDEVKGQGWWDKIQNQAMQLQRPCHPSKYLVTTKAIGVGKTDNPVHLAHMLVKPLKIILAIAIKGANAYTLWPTHIPHANEAHTRTSLHCVCNGNHNGVSLTACQEVTVTYICFIHITEYYTANKMHSGSIFPEWFSYQKCIHNIPPWLQTVDKKVYAWNHSPWNF